MTLPRALNPNNAFFKWMSRISCLVFIIAQCGILDYYIINYFVNDAVRFNRTRTSKSRLLAMTRGRGGRNSSRGYEWLALVAVDVICIGLFVAAAITSLNSFYRKRKNGRLIGNGELPLGYIAWGFYSIQLALRLTVIFESNLVTTLRRTWFFGPSTMKTAFALTAVIFVQLILMHHDAPHSSCRHEYVNDIALSTSLDILDSVSVLNVMFNPTDPESKAGSPLHIAVLSVACINIFLPTIPLFILSRDHFGKHTISIWFQISYRLARIMFSDIAMFVVRIMIVSTQDTVISVFAIKNLISLAMNLKWLAETLDARDEEKELAAHHHDHDHDLGGGGDKGDGDIEPAAIKMAFSETANEAPSSPSKEGKNAAKKDAEGSAAKQVAPLLKKRQSSRLSDASHQSHEMCLRHRTECLCSCHNAPLGRPLSVDPAALQHTDSFKTKVAMFSKA